MFLWLPVGFLFCLFVLLLFADLWKNQMEFKAETNRTFSDLGFVVHRVAKKKMAHDFLRVSSPESGGFFAH